MLGDGSAIPDEKDKDKALARAANELDLQDAAPLLVTPEKELRARKEMVAEVADEDDEDLQHPDILAGVSGNPEGSAKPSLRKKVITPASCCHVGNDGHRTRDRRQRSPFAQINHNLQSAP